MSAIFGRIHLDGRPVSGDALDAAESELASWGPDGGGRHVSESVALGCRRLRVTPEPDDGRPIAGPDGSVLVGIARLDNRDELLDLLGISPDLRAGTNDIRIVAGAWLRWGDGCPARLLGDWSFAVWDPRRSRLLLARDQAGNQGVFYAHRGPVFAFASASWVVPDLAGISRRVDEGYFVEYLAQVWTEGPPSRSPFADVQQLLPGTWLTVDARGLRVTTYWRPFEAPPLRLRSEGEHLDLLFERFRSAVRTRLRSSRGIACALSGGLDSTSVAALAAESLAERGQRLLALTAVPTYPRPGGDRGGGRITDEWPLARSVALRCGNVDHVPVRGDRYSPVSALERALDVMPHPHLPVTNLYWILDLLGEARDRGAGVLLTGQFGNLTVSWNGGRFRVLGAFMRGRIDEGYRELRAYRDRRGTTWIQAVHSQLLAPIRALLTENFRGLGAHSPRRGFLNPEIARRLGVHRLALRSTIRGFRRSTDRAHEARSEILLLNASLAGPLWHALGAAHGLEVRDPTTDVRLIEACGAMPPELAASDGLERAPIRRIMAGHLPEEVRLNDRRGQQSADLLDRLLACPDEVEEALSGEPVEGIGSTLDQGALQGWWNDLKNGGPPRLAPRSAAASLLHGLMAKAFLARAGTPSRPVSTGSGTES